MLEKIKIMQKVPKRSEASSDEEYSLAVERWLSSLEDLECNLNTFITELNLAIKQTNKKYEDILKVDIKSDQLRKLINDAAIKAEAINEAHEGIFTLVKNLKAYEELDLFGFFVEDGELKIRQSSLKNFVSLENGCLIINT